MRCLNCFREINEDKICSFCHSHQENVKNKLNCLQPGVTLNEGRYLIGKAINAGGFGIVYKAFDRTLEIVVAIKEFFPSQLASRVVRRKEIVLIENTRGISFAESKESFLNEARIMEKLKENPNIVSSRDWFEENNTAYIVMEYIEGINVRDFLIQNENKLDVESTQSIVKQIINALKYIHEKGYIFRDLTPDNIMITTDYDNEGHNIIKLIDFGAVVNMNATVDTAHDDVILKPGYAPIEQYVSGGVLGAYTDVYALGATAYRMLSGLVPYEVTDRNENDLLEKLVKLNESIPEYIDRTIMKAMAVDKKVRFQTVEEFEKAFIQEQQVLYPEEELRKLRNKKRIFFTFFMVICVALAGVGIYIKDKKNTGLNHIEVTADKISVILPYTNESDKKYLDEIVTDYIKKQKVIKVDTKWVQKAEYQNYIQSLDKLPTVFINEGYISQEKMASLNILLESLNSNDYYFYDDYMEHFEYQLPLGFDMAVCYVNLNKGDVETPLLKKEVNSTVGFNQDYFFTLDKDQKNLISTKQKFLSEQIPYYVGNVTEWKDIYQALNGYWDVKSFNNTAYIHFGDYISVSKNETYNQRIAGMLFIYELLSDLAQNNRYIQADGLLPVNKETCQLFIKLNPSFNFIIQEKNIQICN